MDNFEAEWINLVRSIEKINNNTQQQINNNTQQQIKNDLKKVENSNKIKVKANKSSNVYKMSPNKYKQRSY